MSTAQMCSFPRSTVSSTAAGPRARFRCIQAPGKVRRRGIGGKSCADPLQAAGQLDGSLKLVVTDINMPVMDGLEFAKALRALHPTVPIVFVTGRTTSTIASLCETDGRATVLGKPFTGETLLHIVSQALQGKGGPITGP